LKTENHENDKEETKSMRHVTEKKNLQDSQRNQGEMIQELKIGSVKLQVMKGLIWLQRTDAIVCPCENTSLRHIKGIAASIQEYAGPQIF
jgi:hypothetical protein